MRILEVYELAEEAPLLELPLYETLVPAGFPSPAEDWLGQKLDLNRYLVKREYSTFYAKVQGDSMIGAGIFDGDVIVVDRSQFPAEGKIVVAKIEGEQTVKRIHYQGEKIILLAENDKYPSIEITNPDAFEFIGVVVGSVRKF